jgi:hypothetical protein
VQRSVYAASRDLYIYYVLVAREKKKRSNNAVGVVVCFVVKVVEIGSNEREKERKKERDASCTVRFFRWFRSEKIA